MNRVAGSTPALTDGVGATDTRSQRGTTDRGRFRCNLRAVKTWPSEASLKPNDLT
jgi:hypothetical protein